MDTNVNTCDSVAKEGGGEIELLQQLKPQEQQQQEEGHELVVDDKNVAALHGSEQKQNVTSIPEDEAVTIPITTQLGTNNTSETSSTNASCWSKEWISSFVLDWCMSIVIGFCVVSYWRGTWILLDIWTCDQDTDGSAGMVNGESFCFAANFVDPNRYTSAWQTYLAGNILLLLALTLLGCGVWTPPNIDTSINTNPINNVTAASNTIPASDSSTKKEKVKITFWRACGRVISVYIFGCATVCIWHGIWYFVDYFFMTSIDDIVRNWWFSTWIGILVCFALLAGNSLLAPPGIFLYDGPSYVPPPIGVTIISSYKSIVYPVAKIKVEKENVFVAILDTLISYMLLPWPVVGFWRGCWYLMDEYLYAWGDSRDLFYSILYSTILGIGLLFVASEDFVYLIPSPPSLFMDITTAVTTATMKGGTTDGNVNRNDDNDVRAPGSVCMRWVSEIVMRIRTVALAVGCVNFWRAVWLTWDEFLGGTTTWSAALSHVFGILCLLGMGCLSCICAPPSTIGADAVADSECADEPLFSNVPVHAELLYALSIGRQADTGLKQAPSVPPVELRPILERSKSARFYESSGSHVQTLTRSTSTTSSRLGSRNMSKRANSQFFRSR